MASSRRGEAECGDIGSIDTGTGTPAGGMVHGHGAQGTGHGVGVGVGVGVATGCSAPRCPISPEPKPTPCVRRPVRRAPFLILCRCRSVGERTVVSSPQTVYVYKLLKCVTST